MCNRLSRFAFVLIPIFVLLTISCTPDTKYPLRIGTNVWPGYEPLYLARQQKYWNQKNIRLVEYQSATEVLRAFRNNVIDAASLTLDEVLSLRQANIPVKVVLVHDISNGGDTIVARPPISTVRGLKNKRVAIEANALGALIISRALHINNLSIADIKIFRAEVSAHEKLYSNGKVDAVVTFEPIRTKLLQRGAKEIFTSREIPNEIVDVLVVREDYINTNRNIVQELVDGWFKALDYMSKNKRHSAEIISRRLKIKPEEVEESYAGIIIPDRKNNIALLAGNDAVLNLTLETLNEVLVSHKLLKSRVNTEGLLMPEFVIK